MDFLTLLVNFENTVSNHFKFDLLEQCYVPYLFGSGFAAYRINGKVFKIVFDGRDKFSECLLSEPHIKYKEIKKWNIVFHGKTDDLIQSQFKEVLLAVKS